MSRLIRWNPDRQMSLFDEMFDKPWRSFFDENFSVDNRLAMDVKETDNGYHVSADIPGVNPEDIDIRVEDNVLTISVESSRENIEREGERVIMSERSFGKTSRSLRMPVSIDADNIDASYNDGVLELDLPKVPEKQPKRIEVKSGK